VLDITAQPPEEYINKFDVVINVSTVEEVDADHLEIIKNLLMQVRVGGYLIITFDLPGMQLRKLERLFNISISVIAMI
jgi:ABC-type transporter Mla MlaB component